MEAWKLVVRHKHSKPRLLNPVTDDEQIAINEFIDDTYLSRLDLIPTDPRAMPYLRSALWLWK